MRAAASLEAFADAGAAAADARSVSYYFDRLVAVGWLSRLDETVVPTMFKAPTVMPDELAQLRRIAAPPLPGPPEVMQPTA